MNILLVTNTFTPHVGGVTRSVVAFAREYRQRGHRVLVLAPRFPNMPAQEPDVLRVAAIQNFNASDFSVALDASGVREVVRDGWNGRLLQTESVASFSAALAWVRALPAEQRTALQRHALDTAATYSMPRSADKALGLYTDLIARGATATQREDHHWEYMLTWIRTEWKILKSLAEAGDAAVAHVHPKDPTKGGQIAP